MTPDSKLYDAEMHAKGELLTSPGFDLLAVFKGMDCNVERFLSMYGEEALEKVEDSLRLESEYLAAKGARS